MSPLPGRSTTSPRRSVAAASRSAAARPAGVPVIAFTNEEGARFSPPMMGSGAAMGIFTEQEILDKRDAGGARFGDALEAIGWKGEADPADLRKLGAYFELHIEQGPILEAEDHRPVRHRHEVEGAPVICAAVKALKILGHADLAAIVKRHKRLVQAKPVQLRGGSALANRQFDMDARPLSPVHQADCHVGLGGKLTRCLDYVIDALAHLLAEISVIVNGPEPAGTKWSYHDLPEKVAELKRRSS